MMETNEGIQKLKGSTIKSLPALSIHTARSYSSLMSLCRWARKQYKQPKTPRLYVNSVTTWSTVREMEAVATLLSCLAVCFGSIQLLSIF